MPATVVIGAQWGDEGKGKIVDALAEQAEVIVRFQGGNNAGHTLIVDINGTPHKTVLHVVPCGVLYEGKVSVVGPGVVVDPAAILLELEGLAAIGFQVPPERLYLSARANLIMPYHKAMDKAREAALGKNKIGTTGRGIGPCYEDKVGRRGITLQDLMDEKTFISKVEAITPQKSHMLRFFRQPMMTAQSIIDEYLPLADRIRPYVRPVTRFIQEATRNGNVLFEGAQGTLLDISQGTYPFVTSSNTVAAACSTSTGVRPQDLKRIIGITKAYSTRVGAGPYPTELEGAVGQFLRKAGQEFGATTGRPRRCGWLDIPALKYAIQINGLTELIVTKLDVLSGLDEVKICTSYEDADGNPVEFDTYPGALDDIRPVYTWLPGWTEDISGATGISDLPKAAFDVVRAIEDLTKIPVSTVSVGPGRNALIEISGS